MPKYPNWYYSFVEIPELQEIQQQCRHFFEKNCSPEKTVFAGFTKHNLPPLPALIRFLDRVNLIDKWNLLFVAGIISNDNYPVHIDSMDVANRNFSLNLPVLDTENTYVRWHNVQPNYQKPWPVEKDHPIDPSFAEASYCDCGLEENIVAQVESIRPILMNVNIPHSVVNPNNKIRKLLVLRFRPELDEDDLARLGVSYPLIQTDPIC